MPLALLFWGPTQHSQPSELGQAYHCAELDASLFLDMIKLLSWSVAPPKKPNQTCDSCQAL